MICTIHDKGGGGKEMMFEAYCNTLGEFHIDKIRERCWIYKEASLRPWWHILNPCGPRPKADNNISGLGCKYGIRVILRATMKNGGENLSKDVKFLRRVYVTP